MTASAGRRSGRLALGALVLALAALPALTGCGGLDPAPSWLTSNPFAGRTLYVDPDSTAVAAVREHPADASTLQAIAATAQARWFTDQVGIADITAAVDRYVTAATAAGGLPLLTAYAIPQRDCGRFSAGGLPDATAYASWIRGFAAGIGGRAAAVVLEPDSVAGLDCLEPSGRRTRTEILADAVRVLSAAGASVYLDGGHSGWVPADELAERLVDAGIRDARGFSLNVSNFRATADEIAYGEQVADRLGGARYVVDTSRNGAGAAPDGPLNWCNPPGRALGTRPTADAGPGATRADALLWVKHPGESDGECDRGEPPAGQWFHSYALALIAGS